MTTGISETDLAEAIGQTKVELVEAVPSTSRSREAKLTGLEILGFLAAKVVLPLALGFISRILYDKYKDMQTSQAAEEARKELTEKDNKVAEPADEATMQRELTEMLVSEGIPRTEAQNIIVQAMTRLKPVIRHSA